MEVRGLGERSQLSVPDRLFRRRGHPKIASSYKLSCGEVNIWLFVESLKIPGADIPAEN